MNAYNRTAVEAEQRRMLKQDMRHYGCQFDGTEDVDTLRELHRIIIDDPAAEAQKKLASQYMGMIDHAARHFRAV